MEPDRSRHAVCRLNTALRLLAGKDVHVPARAFPLVSPSRLARGLQLANSAFNLVYWVAPGRTIVSGASLAYLSGELEYFSDDVARRALRLLASKRPFFLIAGAPEDSLRREISCDPVPKPGLRFGAHCAVIVSGRYQGIPAIFRVGSCDEARAEVLRQANGLKLAKAAPYFQNLVPQLLLQFTSPSGLQVSIETAVPGRAAPFSWKCLDAAMDLCLASESTNTLARPSLEEDLARVCDAFPAHRDSFSAFADALLDWHAASRWLGHIVHGDLWLGNVLFSGDSVTGIIDWEWAHQGGFLFADALQLLLMSYSVYRGAGIAETLRSVWTNAGKEHELNARLNIIRGRFGFDSRDLKFAALVLWFNYLHERVVRGRMPSASYTEDMLPRTIPSIKAWLNADERRTSEPARSRTERFPE
jgi:phosphotransferase family enzyme